ncbi:MAG: 1-phosphofructokinase, partial [Gemmatimonadetes bacterium]|nr:1-phosphofructokinase [Gemmatimonadota bacterium]
VTVTPNPSLDLLFEVDELVWNDANRVAPARARPGGQGVNAVRAIRELGGRGLAVLPLGGIVGDQIRRMLEEERTPIRTVDVRAETRVFVGVREHSTGRDLLLNPRGRRLSAAEVDTLAEAALSALGVEARWLACCGSLPAGLPDDFYARLGAEARQLGVKFVPDCDGMPLRLAAAAGCDLLVPNIHEAGRLLNRPVARAGAGAAARALLDFGPTHTCITLGADGAV